MNIPFKSSQFENPQHDVKRIQSLPEHLASSIHSQVNITSIAECSIELIKNSIDANATNVSVILDFKRLSIKVTDNGEGILPQDLENFGKPRYTSKWNPNSPILTLGYKGVALASIASLAIVVVNSRHILYGSTKSLRITYGQRIPIYNSSDPRSKPGTSVSVTGIFSQIPARQKYILSISPTTHLEQLKRAIIPIAISRPNVTISVHDSDNKSLLHISSPFGTSVPRDVSVLRSVHGLHIADRWQTIHTKVKDIDVRGTVAFDPVRSKQAQHIIVNSVRVNESKLYKDLNNLLLTLSTARDEDEAKVYMVYVFEVNYAVNMEEYALNPISNQKLDYITKLLIAIVKKFLKAHGYSKDRIKLPSAQERQVKKQKPSSVDALVHSGARQARFDINEQMGRLITVGEQQKNKENIPDSSHEGSCCNRTNLDYMDSMAPSERFSIKSQLGPRILNTLPSQQENKKTANSKYILQGKSGYDLSGLFLEKKFSKSDFGSLKLISQVDNKFLLVTINNTLQNSKCVAIIDQHAADERVKLEKFLGEITSKSLQATATPLAYPKKINLSEQEYNFFQEQGQLYREFGIFFQLGFETNISNPYLLLTHIPELGFRKVSQSTGLIDSRFADRLILSHAKDVMERKVSAIPVNHGKHWSVLIRNYPQALMELFQSKACRSAIKFGDKLATDEAEMLIENLSKCMFPFQCAHGRPSMVPLIDLANDQNVNNSNDSNAI